MQLEVEEALSSPLQACNSTRRRRRSREQPRRISLDTAEWPSEEECVLDFCLARWNLVYFKKIVCYNANMFSVV